MATEESATTKGHLSATTSVPLTFMGHRAPNWLGSKNLHASDFAELVFLSTSRIACFQFRDSLPISSSPDEASHFLWNSASVCLWASLAFQRHFRHGDDYDIFQRSFAELFPPSSNTQDFISEFCENGLTLQNYELDSIDAEGKRSLLLLSLYPIIDGKEVSRLWVVFRDATHSRRLVEKLQTSERAYRTLVERPGLVLVRVKPDGEFLYISPLVEDVIGRTAQDFKDTPTLLREYIHPEDRARHEEIYRARTLRSPEVVELEYRVRCKDGQYRWFLERQTPQMNERGEVEYFDSVTMNIQDKKTFEIEMLQAERMKTLGSLATGLAYEFNAHLSSMRSEIGALRDQLPKEHSCFHHLRRADHALESCSQVAHQLLSFDATSPKDGEWIDMGILIERFQTLLPHLLPSNVTKEVEITPETCPILGNRAYLQQALIGLAVRAARALTHGGTFRVTAAMRPIPPDTVLVDYPAVPAGTYVEIVVRDNGEPIPSSELNSLFQFRPSRSTDLSYLEIAASVVRSMHGHFFVQSTEQDGTVARLLLPASTGTRSALAGVAPSSSAPKVDAASKLVLVAEDDDLVLSLIRTALALQGYKILTAKDGEQALQKFRRHSEMIALAIIDFTMPRLSGEAVTREIHRSFPSLPVILTSGHGRSAELERLISEPHIDYLSKPFSISALLDQVEATLSRDSETPLETPSAR